MIMEEKKKLRKQSNAARACLTKEERASKSLLIHEHLYRDNAWKNAGAVMIYYHCRTEVLTDRIIEQALAEDKQVLIPCILSKDTPMIAVKIHELSDIADRCVYGMLQPKKQLCEEFKGNIDVILVPGIVFDARGGRIGSGKGYFDVFLSQHPHAVRIGLAFACQIKETVDQSAHDIKMHKVITEESIITV